MTGASKNFFTVVGAQILKQIHEQLILEKIKALICTHNWFKEYFHRPNVSMGRLFQIAGIKILLKINPILKEKC